MVPRSVFPAVLSVLLLTVSSSFAQSPSQAQVADDSAIQASSLVVTATVSEEQVRFTALGLVRRMRLEVFNQAGERVHDSDFQPGSILDWKAGAEGSGRLPDGLYGCVATVEDFAGRQVNRKAGLWLEGGQIFLSQQRQTGLQAEATFLEPNTA